MPNKNSTPALIAPQLADGLEIAESIRKKIANGTTGNKDASSQITSREAFKHESAKQPHCRIVEEFYAHAKSTTS